MPTHYTPISEGTGVAATAALYNARLQELDDALVNLEQGLSGIKTLKLGTTAAATIDANGAITRTATRMMIDTYGGDAADNLDTINGLTDGQIIILNSTSAARVPTIRHNVGNIYLDAAVNLDLTDPKQTIMLIYDGTLAKAVQVGPGALTLRDEFTTTLQAPRQLVLPANSLMGTGTSRRLAVLPSPEARNVFRVRAAAATVQALGIATPTVANTPTNANDTDGAFTNLPSTASAGNIAGLVSATFNLVRRQWNPTFYARIKTPADPNFNNLRFWIGLISADVTNVDTLAGATEFAGFRYSMAAGDTGWLPVSKDASTQSGGVAMGVVVANTLYELRVRVDSANGRLYFSVNGSNEQLKTTNLPQEATDLGFVVRVIPTGAAIRTLSFSELYVEMN